MSSFRFYSALILFIFISINNCFSQNDSDKVRVGPEELQISKGGHYFNFSDKNKVNIEVIMLGLGAGKYLIPKGTTLFDFLIMAGGTSEYIMEDVKIVRFSSESPKMKATEVINYDDLADLYGNKEDILRTKKNPVLQPGDMLIVPQEKSEQSIFYYIQQTIYFVGTLLSFYYLIDNTYNRFR